MLPSHTSAALLKRLVRDYVGDHRKRIALAVACMIAAAATTAANAWMMQPVLDEIFLKKNAAMLALLPFAVMAVAVASGAANYGHSVIMRQVGQSIIARMQMQLFSHFIHSDLGMFHDRGTGHLISRFTNDIQLMRSAVSNVLTGLARETLSMIFLVGIMFHQSVPLAILALLVFPIAGLPVIRLGRRMRKLSDSTQKQLGDFTAQLDETFQGVRIVKAYGQEDYETNRAGRIIGQLFALYYKAARVQCAAAPMMETLGGVAIAAVIWYGGAEVLRGQTTPGAFFSFVTAMIMAYRPAKVIASLNTNLQEGLAAASRLFEALDRTPRIVDAPGAAALSVARGEVRFENVTFHYAPGAGGVEDITLHIPAGRKVALVGPSGGGKSTLMNLLLRFYDAESGAITIDGQNIREVSQRSLRAAMALVSQENVLFDDTVAGNIRYGKLDASEEEVIAAAQGANADAFIRRLPQGYATVIGPHGVKLSGGQRQRLAIARAMLKNAPILLLDEATSSLDAESERAVQRALETLMEHRSSLVIAHRLSTVIDADIIYVVEHGRIVQAGTHAQLLAQDGTYSQLYATQAEFSASVSSSVS